MARHGSRSVAVSPPPLPVLLIIINVVYSRSFSSIRYYLQFFSSSHSQVWVGTILCWCPRSGCGDGITRGTDLYMPVVACCPRRPMECTRLIHHRRGRTTSNISARTTAMRSLQNLRWVWLEPRRWTRHSIKSLSRSLALQTRPECGWTPAKHECCGLNDSTKQLAYVCTLGIPKVKAR